MEFLGMTALNDQLREDVPLVIETLELAGITVWIATGKNWELSIFSMNKDVCLVFKIGDSMEQAMSTAI